jgi:hypothetical protein
MLYILQLLPALLTSSAPDIQHMWCTAVASNIAQLLVGQIMSVAIEKQWIVSAQGYLPVVMIIPSKSSVNKAIDECSG